MKNEIVTPIPRRLIQLAIIKVTNNQRKVIGVTVSDRTDVINEAIKTLHGTSERISTLYELGLYSQDEFTSMMSEQKRLEERLNGIVTKKKARQWSGNSRQAVK